MRLKRSEVKAFEAWLTQHDARVIPTHGPRELVRFMVGNTVCIISNDGAKGNAQFNRPAAASALAAFQQGLSWRSITKNEREKLGRPLAEVIRERDGNRCFFCRLPVALGTGSIEHLVAVADGGPHHPSNLYLAHKEPCNREADRLSAVEKVQIAIRNELALRGVAPEALPRLAA